MKTLAEVCRMWALGLALAALSLAAFAPAPFRKAPRGGAKFSPPPLCEMRWGVARYNAWFRADGTYTAASMTGHGVWYGSWRYDARAKTLHISESATPEIPKSWAHYEVAIDPATMSGTIRNPHGVAGGWTFELR